MNTSKDASSLTLSSAGAAARCSPLTEIFNPTALPLRDWLFVSVTDGCVATGGGGCVMSFDIAGAAFPSVNTARAAAGGTSGIVVDNVSPSSQASSIYFSTQADGDCASDAGVDNTGCAVKLTQSGLN